MTNIFKSIIEFWEREARRGFRNPSKLSGRPDPSSHVFPIVAYAAACIESISANMGAWDSRIVERTYLTSKTESWFTFNRNCGTLNSYFCVVRDNRPWALGKEIPQYIKYWSFQSSINRQSLNISVNGS